MSTLIFSPFASRTCLRRQSSLQRRATAGLSLSLSLTPFPSPSLSLLCLHPSPPAAPASPSHVVSSSAILTSLPGLSRRWWGARRSSRDATGHSCGLITVLIHIWQPLSIVLQVLNDADGFIQLQVSATTALLALCQRNAVDSTAIYILPHLNGKRLDKGGYSLISLFSSQQIVEAKDPDGPFPIGQNETLLKCRIHGMNASSLALLAA